MTSWFLLVLYSTGLTQVSEDPLCLFFVFLFCFLLTIQLEPSPCYNCSQKGLMGTEPLSDFKRSLRSGVRLPRHVRFRTSTLLRTERVPKGCIRH